MKGPRFDPQHLHLIFLPLQHSCVSLSLQSRAIFVETKSVQQPSNLHSPHDARGHACRRHRQDDLSGRSKVTSSSWPRMRSPHTSANPDTHDKQEMHTLHTSCFNNSPDTHDKQEMHTLHTSCFNNSPDTHDKQEMHTLHTSCFNNSPDTHDKQEMHTPHIMFQFNFHLRFSLAKTLQKSHFLHK